MDCQSWWVLAPLSTKSNYNLNIFFNWQCLKGIILGDYLRRQNKHYIVNRTLIFPPINAFFEMQLCLTYDTLTEVDLCFYYPPFLFSMSCKIASIGQVKNPTDLMLVHYRNIANCTWRDSITVVIFRYLQVFQVARF